MSSIHRSLFRNIALSALAMCLAHATFAFGRTITTIAGGGAGDGGSGLQASLKKPKGIAVDAAGNIYVADRENNRIRKIAPDGVISTLAGNGQRASTGDGGLAVNAKVASPIALALDSGGNLFFSEDNRIRKIAPNGIITTVAGGGSDFSSDNIPATSAYVQLAEGLAVDASGNIFFTDNFLNRVRKVGVDGKVVTVAGSGQRGFSGDGGLAIQAKLDNPTVLALASNGDIYFIDRYNKRIRKIDQAGIISTIAGNDQFTQVLGGPATASSLFSPNAIAFDASGALLLSDVSSMLLKINASGIISRAFSGPITCNDPFPPPCLTNISGIASDLAGNIFITDDSANTVRKILPSAVANLVAGVGDYSYAGEGISATQAQFKNPRGVWADAAGNILIADTDNQRVRRISNSGIVTTVAGTITASNEGDGGLAITTKIRFPDALAGDSSSLYISSAARVRVVFSSGTINTYAGSTNGGFGGDLGPATSALLNTAGPLALDAAGNLYIVDTYNFRVRKVTPAGIISTVAGNGSPAYGQDGVLATQSGMSPTAVAVDSQGRLHIAANNRIIRVAQNGTLATVAGTGILGSAGNGGPAKQAAIADVGSMFFDGSDNLYLVEPQYHQVRRITSSGLIYLVAGGSYGFSGDGGPAYLATLLSPRFIALHPDGSLLISDSGNDRIRKVTGSVPAQPVVTAVRPAVSGAVVEFQTVSDGNRDIIDFNVVCIATDLSGSGSAMGTASPVVVSGLVPGKNYNCKVSARNVIGTSTVSANSVAVTAAAQSFTVNVNKTGSGAAKGTVTASIPGFDCGADCTEEIPAGTRVIFYAIPAVDSGVIAAGWSGVGCEENLPGVCTTTINQASTVQANFGRYYT